MRPRADEVKIGNRVVPIVGAEPGALPQQRFEAEGAAEMRREVAPEITRRIVKAGDEIRSEEHTSELQSLMRISYAVFCLTQKTKHNTKTHEPYVEISQPYT